MHYVKNAAKVVQIERNTKGKVLFLCISEMQPTFGVANVRLFLISQ